MFERCTWKRYSICYFHLLLYCLAPVAAIRWFVSICLNTKCHFSWWSLSFTFNVMSCSARRGNVVPQPKKLISILNQSKPNQTKYIVILLTKLDSIVELQKCVRIKNVYKSSRSEKCVNDTVNEFAQKVLGRAYCNWNENTPNMNEILWCWASRVGASIWF